jgi:hypothetical protein
MRFRSLIDIVVAIIVATIADVLYSPEIETQRTLQGLYYYLNT